METEKKNAMQDLYNVAMQNLAIQRETFENELADFNTMTIQEIEKAERKFEEIRVENDLDKYKEGFELH